MEDTPVACELPPPGCQRNLIDYGLWRTPALIEQGYRNRAGNREEMGVPLPFSFLDLNAPQGVKSNPNADRQVDASEFGWRALAHNDHKEEAIYYIFGWLEEFFGEGPSARGGLVEPLPLGKE